MKLLTLASVLCLAFTVDEGGARQVAAADDARAAVEAVLTEFHRAKSAADGESYFALIAPDAIYLGTAPEERWTVDEMRALLEPYFADGVGLPSKPVETNVSVSKDGRMAWFDERLERPKFGELRGTGALQLQDDGWKIVQYSVSLPVPNEAVRDVVKLIRHAQKK